MAMTQEEREVITEILDNIIYNKGTSYETCQKQWDYNHKYGKIACYELIDKYFLEIVSSVSLTEEQYSRLERMLEHLDYEWVLVKEIPEEVKKNIIVEGEAFVILRDLTRMDFEPDRFKKEREEFNRKKLERRKRKRMAQ